MLSVSDYAGSGMRIRDALRRHTDHEIVLITDTKPGHSADYSVCEMLTEPKQDSYKHLTIHERIRNKSVLDAHYRSQLTELQQLIDEADIIHFKGDEPPSNTFAKYLNIPEGKKIVVTVGGSGFRRVSNHKRTSLAKWPMELYMKADLRTALTPDLNYPEFDGIYTQQAIDSENIKTVPYRDLDYEDAIVIAHSPSSRFKKGTDEILLPAIQRIRENLKFNIQTDVIEKVPYDECVSRKREAHLFFDQAGVGFYGNAALEAMAAGIPTVCHISSEAVKQSSGKIDRNHPVYAFRKPTVHSCLLAVKRAVEQYTPEAVEKTKEFCDKFHSYSTVAEMWDGLYRSLYD